MAVQIKNAGQSPISDTADVTADVADDAINRSGVALPLIHTTIDAEFVTEHGGHRLLITVDRTEVETPPLEHIAFYIGVGTLVGVGLVEPPIGIALCVGHLLIGLTRRPGLQALGEALGEA
jgi:hypothetical protein